MKKKNVYISVRTDYMNPNPTLSESLSALPDVVECRQMYPDDPALSNILLVVTDVDDPSELLTKIRGCEDVTFADITRKPIPR